MVCILPPEIKSAENGIASLNVFVLITVGATVGYGHGQLTLISR